RRLRDGFGAPARVRPPLVRDDAYRPGAGAPRVPLDVHDMQLDHFVPLAEVVSVDRDRNNRHGGAFMDVIRPGWHLEVVLVRGSTGVDAETDPAGGRGRGQRRGHPHHAGTIFRRAFDHAFVRDRKARLLVQLDVPGRRSVQRRNLHDLWRERLPWTDDLQLHWHARQYVHAVLR